MSTRRDTCARAPWRNVAVNFACLLAGYLSLRAPFPGERGGRGRARALGARTEATGEERRRGERGREWEPREAEIRIELPGRARRDIVFRYRELRVWVFALNRRERRKTRGLLRPRGLSYQIDAAVGPGLGVGTGRAPRYLKSFSNARPLVDGGWKRAQSTVSAWRSARERGTPSSYRIGCLT